MTGEINLKNILSTMKPILREEIYAFASLKDQSIPAGISPVMTYQENEGLTLIARLQEIRAAGLDYTYPCRMITLTVHSSLQAVGFLAVLATKLAEAGISINAVSAYYHDHLFVPVERAEEALAILQKI